MRATELSLAWAETLTGTSRGAVGARRGVGHARARAAATSPTRGCLYRERSALSTKDCIQRNPSNARSLPEHATSQALQDYALPALPELRKRQLSAASRARAEREQRADSAEREQRAEREQSASRALSERSQSASSHAAGATTAAAAAAATEPAVGTRSPSSSSTWG